MNIIMRPLKKQMKKKKMIKTVVGRQKYYQ